MTSLKKASLDLKVEKCEFQKKEVKYLELIIGVNRIRMDLEKAQAVENWKAPETLEEVQAFLGFANFYQQFIRNYTRVVQRLTKITK
jgi:hypothetical protein